MTRTAVQQRLQLHVQTAQVNCPSPHFPSYHSPRDGDEFAPIRGRCSRHRTLVRS
jgi:hypothetical protein